jgi:DNA primase
MRVQGPIRRRRVPGAVKPTTLPLYGAHELPDAGARVALVEGETSRDALARLGLPAVATVCGASAVMSDESLSVLRGYRVVLWPDNDAPGIEHMRRHGLALLRLGVEVFGSVSWTRYAAGDAADLVLEHRDHLEVAFLAAVELLEDAIWGTV